MFFKKKKRKGLFARGPNMENVVSHIKKIDFNPIGNENMGFLAK